MSRASGEAGLEAERDPGEQGRVTPSTFSDVQVGEAGLGLPGPGAGASGGRGWGGQGKQGQAPDAGGVAERRWGL